MIRRIGNITVLAISAMLLSVAVYEGGLGLLQLLGMEPSGNRANDLGSIIFIFSD